MVPFLEQDGNLGEDVAVLLDLTPRTYFEHTGDSKYLDYPDNQGCEDEPHKILGWMALKVFKEADPCTQQGRLYGQAECDFFWSQLTANMDAIAQGNHAAIRGRTPSPKLRLAVMREVGRAPVFTHTGRLRANATFCARHNTIFQGLAADGTKLGLWHVWRAGYRVVNFIHDELLVELPDTGRLDLHAEIVRHLMIKGMREVVPDVRVDVEFFVADRWTKSGEIVRDAKGGLVTWCDDESAIAG